MAYFFSRFEKTRIDVPFPKVLFGHYFCFYFGFIEIIWFLLKVTYYGYKSDRNCVYPSFSLGDRRPIV